ncbi:calpastatin-like [Falco biarmicus]|uniref:calpastatin-like n=1 Tax=Falco biarmicus TaxID=345155 RepID=UPI0024BD178A|nr:calpastatin-like [Falco biarmicus]
MRVNGHKLEPSEFHPNVRKNIFTRQTNRNNAKKLGEDVETIPPDYRLTEEKDKDGKPLLPKPEEKPQPVSEDDLLLGLTEGFSCSPPSSPLRTPTVLKKIKKDETPADSLDLIAAATVPSVRSAAPLASTSVSNRFCGSLSQTKNWLMGTDRSMIQTVLAT